MTTPDEVFSAANKTILVVDDAEENIDILLSLLDGYDVLVALDGESAVEIALEESVDLILLDIVMPGINGYETCRRLKQNPNTSDIPVVFITAKTDEASIEEAYDVGGVDYVSKPFKPKEVLARVKTQLDVRSLIVHLEHLSSFDVMTGVYNRRKFFELGQIMFERRSTRLYAMMIDIDKFKDINDTYGHASGDRAIVAMAQTLQQRLQEGLCPDALVGRLGGEEFAILGEFDSPDAAIKTIETLRQATEQISVTTDGGASIGFTISGGMTLASERHISLDHLLKEADDGLYEAKGAGRNQAIFRV